MLLLDTQHARKHKTANGSAYFGEQPQQSLRFDWVLPHDIIIHQGLAIRKVGVVSPSKPIGHRTARNSPRFPFWAPVASLLAFEQPDASPFSGRVQRASGRRIGGYARVHTGSWGFGRAGPHTNGGCPHTRRVVVRELLARCIPRPHQAGAGDTQKTTPLRKSQKTSTVVSTERCRFVQPPGGELDTPQRGLPTAGLANLTATSAGERDTGEWEGHMGRICGHGTGRTPTTWRNSLVRPPCVHPASATE